MPGPTTHTEGPSPLALDLHDAEVVFYPAFFRGVSSIGPENWNKPYTPSFSGATGLKSSRFAQDSPQTGRITRLIHSVLLCSHQQ
jgi:hypothetical protein